MDIDKLDMFTAKRKSNSGAFSSPSGSGAVTPPASRRTTVEDTDDVDSPTPTKARTKHDERRPSPPANHNEFMYGGAIV
jgi:hypothetical protein